MKKSLKRIFAGLLSAVTLGCCLPAATLGANAEEAEKTYPRDFSYMTSAYGYFFYPEEDSNGNVTAKAYSTLASDYYDNHRYMHEIRDFTFDTWLHATFSATEDGYLKIGTTTNGVNSMGLSLNKFKGILEYNRATYVCVSYKILGKTVSASDEKVILVGPKRDWASTQVKIPITSTNDDWNFAYVSIADLNRSGNWLYDSDGNSPQFRIQLPDFNDTSVSVVLNYVGFCKDLDALNATKAKIEKANSVIENSVANRRYGDSAIGIYFNTAVADSTFSRLTVTYPGKAEANTVDLGNWPNVSELSASATDEGFVKVRSNKQGGNEFHMESTTAWVDDNVNGISARYIIIRFKVDGEAIPTSGDILLGRNGAWASTDNRSDIPVTGATADANGWVTLCYQSPDAVGSVLFAKNELVLLYFPSLNNDASTYVLDYIGLCATEEAKDETLAAIALANSVELVGVQTAENADDHAIRFVGKVKAASVDALNAAVEQLGLRISNGTNTADVKIDKVYKSIVAGGKTLTAVEGEFFFTFVVRNVPTDAQVDFTVTPYAVAAGADDMILALSATVGYDAANNQLVKAKKN